ncbi:MAG: histidine phosphatase family protein [Planctomycetaceae bacterium]
MNRERSGRDGPAMLYLVRHGATEANERKPYVLQGSGIDNPLSAAGRAQAEAVGRFLSDFPLDAVYSSPMRRAAETAAEIARPHGLEVRRLAGLLECHVGVWEGMNWDAIQRDYPAECAAFLENPWDSPYLEGESYRDVLARVGPVFERLLAEHAGGSIAVVGHSVVNRAWLSHLLGVDPRSARDLRQMNGCVNVIRRRDDEVRVLTLNAHFHAPDALE